MKPLIYPKKDRITGIYAYCQKCKTSIGSGKCQKTKKRIQSCTFTQFHTFRASVVVPNTNGQKRKKKILNTCDLTDAIIKKREFEEELKEHNYQFALKKQRNDYQPMLLIECMDWYVNMLKNINVPDHKIKDRSKGYVDEVERFFRYFCKCLKVNGIDHTSILVNELNDYTVGYFHTYLLDELKYENITYNKAMACLRQFLGWLIDKQDYVFKNPFVGVAHRKEVIEKKVITGEDFSIVLDVIKPENSLKIFSNGVKKYYYRPWVKTAIKIALETGLRREEFITLKYSDIHVDVNGKPIFMRIENFKVNRILGLTKEGEKEIKVIPINSNMAKILEECGFKGKQGRDEYILGSEEVASRKTLVNFISRAFTHFWKHTGIDKTIQLKHLRKTYLTALVSKLGNDANLVSSHADMKVLMKHYVNKEALVKDIITKGDADVSIF